MKFLDAVGDFFALDIGTTSINAVQLKKSSSGWSLERVGSVAVDTRIATSDAPDDRRQLGELIMTLVGQAGIHTRNVVLGIPSNKMFATVVEVTDMPVAELPAAVKYLAEQYVPMSLDEAKIDWAVLGKLTTDQTKNEVLLVSVDNKFTEGRLDLIESLGFNVIAIEPDSLAVARSLSDGTGRSNRVLVRFGDNTTDVVVETGDAPKLIRALPNGLQPLVKAIVQNLGVQPDQAIQFVMKFGLLPDKLEGKVVHALESTVEQFITEVGKSIKFFNGKYPEAAISTLVLTDIGSTIPGLSEYITQKTGLPVVPGNPWARVTVSQEDQQRLQANAMTFSVAVGLAMREDK